jgi:DNA polymerase III alpha subunit (gram-positive type)
MNVLTFDLETTGLDFDSDQITQFAAMHFSDCKIKEFQFKLPATKQLSDAAIEKTGFDLDSLKKDSPFDDYNEALKNALNAIVSAISNDFVICGYNVSFDFTMLFNNAARELNVNKTALSKLFNIALVYDAYVIDKEYRRNTNGMSRRLVDVADFYEVPSKPNHDAKYDVRATFEIMQAQLQSYNDKLGDSKEQICKDCKLAAIAQRESLNMWLKTKEHEKLYDGFPILKEI